MKIWRSGLLGRLALARLALASLATVGLAVLLAFSGCEGTTNEDSSGVDAYLAAHPYTSASRDTPSAVVLTLTPVSGTASLIGQTLVFKASGGDGAFHWGVSDSTNGKIESQGADQALYTCLQVGNNDVIVQDDGGHYAVAHISPVATDTVTISPASLTLASGALNASFVVSGGTPPYFWISGNTDLGIVVPTSSSYVEAYIAVKYAYGQNVVTVIDSNGRTASATVTQSL